MKRVALLLVATACGSGSKSPGTDTAPDPPDPMGPAVTDVHTQALGCFSLHLDEPGRDPGWLGTTETGATVVSSAAEAARFTFQPADLGEYLLYDQDGLWLSAEVGPLTRESMLQSDITTLDDGYVSGGEWILEPGARRPDRYQLRSRRHGTL